jgi:hypothetical protein
MAGTLVVDKIQLDIGNTFQIVSNTGGLILSANNAGLQTGIAANSITYGMISPSILATQNNVYNVVSANANTGVGNSTVTFTSNTGAISAGMIVYGAGFGTGTTVSSVINANTILLSTAAANTSTNTRLSFVEPNKLVTAEIVGPGLCKAWVNFSGTGTVAIRAAFNVSSIQDNGTGDYTVNFTTAMPDVNYSIAANSDTTNSSGPQSVVINYSTVINNKVTPTASAFRLACMIMGTGAGVDNPYINASVFR